MAARGGKQGVHCDRSEEGGSGYPFDTCVTTEKCTVKIRRVVGGEILRLHGTKIFDSIIILPWLNLTPCWSMMPDFQHSQLVMFGLLEM